MSVLTLDGFTDLFLKATVVLGLAILLWSIYRYWRVGQDIEHGEYVPRQRGTLVASVGLLLLGGLTGLWLFVK